MDGYEWPLLQHEAEAGATGQGSRTESPRQASASALSLSAEVAAPQAGPRQSVC